MLKVISQEQNLTEMTSEIQLLITCLRCYLKTETPDRIAYLAKSEKIQWEKLLHYSNKHRVTSLLFHVLQNSIDVQVPDEFLEQLKNVTQRIVTRNLFLTNRLLQLLKAFDSNGIKAIPIKGPSLAMGSYHSLTLRQFKDLDILVRQEDALQARDILVFLGYESTYGYTRQQETVQLRSAYFKDYNYFHREGQVIVDLHWRLLQQYLSLQLDHTRLWERARTTDLCGYSTLTLSPEDNLLFVCIHGARDRWITLKLICDVATVLTAEALDWEKVLNLAKEMGCQRRLFLGLYLAYQLMEIVLPETVLAAINDCTSVQPLAQKVIFQLQNPLNEQQPFLERGLFDLQARERWRDKITYGIYQPLLLMARRNGLAPFFI